MRETVSYPKSLGENAGDAICMDSDRSAQDWEECQRSTSAPWRRTAVRRETIAPPCDGPYVLHPSPDAVSFVQHASTSMALEQLQAALADRYHIDREIGRGGMATVYLALDLKHDRYVAVKVLDPELGAVLGVERFLSEIKVTANLQHPNLLPLFDSGNAGGHLYYVMPYIEGETLRARLERERQLPVDEAVRITIAIASALEYAHEHGVIHRDLKPENILMQAGQPVVADFGIALAVSKAGGTRVTQTGLSLGTPQYMSPEQAMSDRIIDRRSDIYSLAAMAYEMLTGDPPHTGSTMQAVIARLRTEQPRKVRLIRPNVPEHVELALERALEKLPADRWLTAREFLGALKGNAGQPATHITSARETAARHAALSQLANPLAIGLTVVALGSLAFGAQMWRIVRAAPAERVTVRFPLNLPPDARPAPSVGQAVSISRDGHLIVFIAMDSAGSTQAYVRRIDDPVARVVPHTQGAVAAFPSPDGKWIAFLDGRVLKKVSIESGAALQLAQQPVAIQGAAWSGREIIFSDNKLRRIPDNGGVSAPLCRVALMDRPNERNPLVLADGETVLFSAFGTGGLAEAKLAVASMSKGTCRYLDIFGLAPLGFVDEFLIYVTAGGVLMGVPFDIGSLRTTGPSIPLMTDIVVYSNTGTAQASLSATGTLTTESGVVTTRLVIADLSGRVTPVPVDVRPYGYPRMSPDGSKMAVTVISSAHREVWSYDMASHPSTKVTEGESVNERPEWSPDGKRILYRTSRDEQSALWWRPADLSGPEEALLSVKGNAYFEGVITPDARYVVFQVDNVDANLLYRALGGSDTTSHPIARSSAIESQARVSPDGRWVAFVTNATGRDEVVVQPFPGPGARTQVSSKGGREPIWSRDGRRIVYRESEQFVAANVRTAAAFSVASREALFRDRFIRGPYHANYDVMPDGAHLLLLEPAEESQLMIVHNWAGEARRRLREASAKSR